MIVRLISVKVPENEEGRKEGKKGRELEDRAKQNKTEKMRSRESMDEITKNDYNKYFR